MDTAMKIGRDASKTTSKIVIQKTVEASGDLTGDKITGKITSVGKTESKENERQEFYIPPVKRRQTIDGLRFF